MEKKTICFSMVFMLLSATATISIGYTNFVQAEIKEDISDIKSNQLLNNEKITSTQINQAELNGNVKLILDILHRQVEDPQ
ncbi:hypothetical protein ES702_02815 [subsurface metagenome]